MNPQREWFEKNYYDILGVGERATAKEIQKAYRKLARELHPDQNPGDASAEERFKEVSAAYDVLGDEAKRKEYDQVRAMGPMAGGPGGGPGGFSRPRGPRLLAGVFPTNKESLDVLYQLRRRGLSLPARPRRSADG